MAYRASGGLVIRAGYGITNDPYSLGRPFKYNYPTLQIATYDPPNSYQWATTLQAGIPATPVPNVGTGIVPLPSAFQTTTIDLNSFKRGYIQSWNFTVQKELRYGFVAQAGYVATRATDQLGPLDINAGQIPGAGSAGQPLKQLYGRTAVTTNYQPLGTNQYNALQSKLERRFAQGVQLAATYTWAKAIGITANDDASPRVNALPYFYLNRTVLNFDRTQNLAISGVFELPFGKGKPWVSENRAASAVLGGWRVNTLLTFMSGLPFSVTASGSSLNMPGQNTQRADQVKATAQILGGIGSGSSYFDPLAFQPVTTARFGNAGFNSMRGPGVGNLDLGIFREFAVKERIRIQFRAEAFNATNTPHFALPGTNVSNLVLNSDGSIRNLAGFSTITGTQNLGRDFDERHLRFGLRISF